MSAVIRISSMQRDRLRRLKAEFGIKNYDEVLYCLEELRESQLKIEDTGDANCQHEIDMTDITDGYGRFIDWACGKCGFKANEFVGLREWNSELVVKAVEIVRAKGISKVALSEV